MSKIAAVADKMHQYFEELDRKYPNRHRQIHKTSCKNCPSEIDKARGIIDPESRDIKESVPKEIIAKEYLFVCAWRNSKLCKGNCDDMGIDQEYLDNLNKDQCQQDGNQKT